MKPARLGVPLFVVVTERPDRPGALSPERLMPFVSQWVAKYDEGDWLIDTAAGVALFNPSLRMERNGRMVGMVLRGNMRVSATREVVSVEDLGRELSRQPIEVLSTLRGNFVLAHWDAELQRLTLARDHLGRKSIFHRRVDDLTLFCSEPGPLQRVPGAEITVADRRSLFWFLAFGGPYPGATLVEGLRQLPAAHFVHWSPGMPVQEVRYWTPLGLVPPARADAAFESAAVTLLQGAIANEMACEAGYCLSLSGGTDLTLLLALAKAAHVGPTFAANVRFEAGLDANEDEYATFAARHFDVPLKLVTLGHADALDLFEQVVGLLPEPCAAWAALSHAALLAGVREAGCDHLCSGFGSDEIFGGYDHYRSAALAAMAAEKQLGTAPGNDTQHFTSLDPSAVSARSYFSGVARFFNEGALARYLEPPYNRWRQDLGQRRFYEECFRLDSNAAPIQAMVAHECQHRIPDIVLKSFEPLAARYGVETAYPFLDPDLCRLAASLPLTDRYRTANGKFVRDRRQLLPEFKWALNQLAASWIPEAIVSRPRKSYTAPFALWMREPRFARRVTEMIGDSRLWHLGIIRKSALDDIFGRLETGPGPRAHQLWCLLVLARWCDVHAVN